MPVLFQSMFIYIMHVKLMSLHVKYLDTNNSFRLKAKCAITYNSTYVRDIRILWNNNVPISAYISIQNVIKIALFMAGEFA